MVQMRMRQHYGIDILRPHRQWRPVTQAQRLHTLKKAAIHQH